MKVTRQVTFLSMVTVFGNDKKKFLEIIVDIINETFWNIFKRCDSMMMGFDEASVSLYKTISFAPLT